MRNELVSVDLPNNLKATWQMRQAPVLVLLSMSLKLILLNQHRFSHLNVMPSLLKSTKPRETQSRSAIFEATRKHLKCQLKTVQGGLLRVLNAEFLGEVAQSGPALQPPGSPPVSGEESLSGRGRGLRRLLSAKEAKRWYLHTHKAPGYLSAEQARSCWSQPKKQNKTNVFVSS